MRILWISFFGKWIAPLLSEIARQNTVALIYPTDCDKSVQEYGATIYKINIAKSDLMTAMTPQVFQKYETIIRDFKPDIIHVHGTEKNLAQIQNYIKDIPVIISIQGIASGYIPFDNGNIKSQDIRPYKSLKNLMNRGGYLQMHREFTNAKREYETDILSKGRFFFCRTNWDKAWVTFTNPHAQIYHGEELLRQPFYDNAGSWKYEKCIKHTIFMPSGFNPIKGLHVALKAIALLKTFYPDVRLVVPGIPHHILNYEGIKEKLIGEDYISYCKDIIRKENIEDNVLFLETLDAEGMVSEMQKANVFLCPSSVENSSNVVGEATMIGMPIVCTPVGGLTSFMRDQDNCLLAPAGDEYMCAFQIKRLFEDDKLCDALGHSAIETARQRHDIQKTVEQYLSAYRDTIYSYKKNQD